MRQAGSSRLKPFGMTSFLCSTKNHRVLAQARSRFLTAEAVRNDIVFCGNQKSSCSCAATSRFLTAEAVRNDKMATVVEDKVVSLGVSPGLGDTEAEFASFVKKCGF